MSDATRPSVAVTLIFPSTAPHAQTNEILSALAFALDETLVSMQIAEPSIDSAAGDANRKFHGDAGIAIATLVVTNIVAFGKILIDVLKDRRVTLEIERDGRKFKYEGPTTPHIERALKRLLKPSDDDDGRSLDDKARR
jgi:hypothetical protein